MALQLLGKLGHHGCGEGQRVARPDAIPDCFKFGIESDSKPRRFASGIRDSWKLLQALPDGLLTVVASEVLRDLVTAIPDAATLD